MSTQTSHRDFATDVLRALALVLMTAIHLLRTAPEQTAIAQGLKFFAESAPAFFFFAFGLTLPSFFLRSGPDQRRLLTLFAYVAVVQSLVAGVSLQMDFFPFLWVWMLVLTLVTRSIRLSNRRLLCVVAPVVLAMLALPYPKSAASFGFLGDPFPLLPWGLFVLSGLAFSGKLKGNINLTLAGGLIVVSFALHLLGGPLGLEGWRMIKWQPMMTGSWFMLFLGLILGVGWMAGILEHQPIFSGRFRRVVEFLSKNLLLGTVLHYLVYIPLQLVFQAGISPWIARFPQSIGRVDFLLMIAAALVAAIALFAILKFELAVWERIAATRLLSRLRHRYDLFAIGATAFCVVFFHFIIWPHYQTNPQSVGWDVKFLSKIVALAFLNYFALEMRQWRIDLEPND